MDCLQIVSKDLERETVIVGVGFFLYTLDFAVVKHCAEAKYSFFLYGLA